MIKMKRKKNKFMSFALRLIPIVVISLVLGVKLYIWNAKALVGNEMPMPFGCGVAVVLSGSMEPTLSVNDLVFVKEQDSYKKGDIVVYQDGNMLVIHRIISIDGDEITTKGDYKENAPDSPIEIDDIKGKAVAHIPFVGAVVRFLNTTVGSLILIIAAILLFELPHLRERKKAEDMQEKIKEEIRKLKGE